MVWVPRALLTRESTDPRTALLAEHDSTSCSTASSHDEACTWFVRQYKALDKPIRKYAKEANRNVDKMIPYLLKMEPILSRKGGGDYDGHLAYATIPGLPKWSDYLKNIAAEYNLSHRHLQRKLETARGEKKEAHRSTAPGPRSKAVVLTAKQTRHMCKVAAKVGEIADLVNHARDFAGAVADLVKMAHTPAELFSILEAQAGVEDDLTAELKVRAVKEAKQEAETFIVSLISAALQYVFSLEKVAAKLDITDEAKAILKRQRTKWHRELNRHIALYHAARELVNGDDLSQLDAAVTDETGLCQRRP
jgi:hypothetical protein